MKRAMDILVSLISLAILCPLILFVWLVLVLAYGYPGFFRQKRVGRFGQEFVLAKFRTMKIMPGSEKGTFEPGNRERATSFGVLLRIHKIDELPQLWNVIKGEMSLVGPRPEIRKWVDTYPERWRKVLSIRPGITDPASLFYRDEEAILSKFPNPESAYRDIILPHKLDIYESYVNCRSLFGDFGIVTKTIGKIFLKSKSL
jgi:lipopolysaccharide/colanic/teichoic acid biosynthesis glycosyltransferase